MAGRWHFWIDRGGTFTDCVGRDPEGRLHVAKVLSSDRAPVQAIRQLLHLDPEEPIPPSAIRMGTTVATNALLERTGAPLVLVATAGLGDALAIGDQRRPDLFDLEIRRPELLYGRVVEVEERVAADGTLLTAPDLEAVARDLEAARAAGFTAAAICLLHAYAHPDHERAVAEVARAAGFTQVSCSHEVAPEIGLVGRGDTTCVDAYLSPLIRAYLDTLAAELPGSELLLMQSSGGLTTAAAFRGHNAILSGPAGGTVAVARIAEACGEARVVGFDMGGTSTDVCRFAGEIERTYETVTAGVRIRAPQIAIHTVAAGGGSICRFDGFRLTVGPDSAGADPGPLCYGRRDAAGRRKARELTLTDVNLALGRLVPDRFPFALDRPAVDAALEAVAAKLRGAGHRLGEEGVEAVAEGFRAVANAAMARAIREVTVDRGHDCRDDALLCFGGAGGQHACGVARALGIRRILLHPAGGVLSALGMGLAPVAWHGTADGGRIALAQAATPVARAFADLEEEGRAALAAQGLDPAAARPVRRLDLRYRGTEAPLTVAEPADGRWQEAFEALHQERFGHLRPEATVEVVAVRLELVVPGEPLEPAGGEAPAYTPEATRTTPLFTGGRWRDVPLYAREALRPGARLTGPCLIVEATGTVVVEAGFTGRVAADGLLTLEEREAGASEAPAVPARGQRATSIPCDPVRLEIYNHLFMSIAEQMGSQLQQTAFSTNIKERLDFSCALFDAAGGLVANAPHIPVHLGAMGAAVRAILERFPEPAAGESYVTNDPAAGGTHLPDVTVVTPIHLEGRLRFFAASRGHHADIGGTTPGSMPPFSRHLEEEGVVITPQRLVAGGRLLEAEMRALLTGGRWPARRVEENLADLTAQLAANQRGRQLVEEMVQRHTLAEVEAYMGHVQRNAAAEVAAAIGRLPDGRHRFTDALDDGPRISVCLTITGERMVIDFTGSDRELDTNLNAPRAVVEAAVIYCLRCLVARPIPLNSGCLGPVELRIPPGSLLAPGPQAAVAGGNVETSQRIVDVLLGALGRVAASQGTMNNLSFGDATFGYYETIAGGAGAGGPRGDRPGFHGASGVHTHMTNTRITDAEVLEARYPVRLVRFALRRASGGHGRWRGGDGLVRHLRFLAPLDVTLLTERRRRPPYGLAGGAPGACGRNRLLRAGHGEEPLPGKAALHVEPGDELIIETPGGGGFGEETATSPPAIGGENGSRQ